MKPPIKLEKNFIHGEDKPSEPVTTYIHSSEFKRYEFCNESLIEFSQKYKVQYWKINVIPYDNRED